MNSSIVTNDTGHGRLVRPRHPNSGSATRPRAVCIRMTERTSNQLASLQGLVWRYGERETLATLFERVCLPALREHVKPYAYKAKAERERGRTGKEAGQ